MIILLHTSKTMRTPKDTAGLRRPPQLLHEAETLVAYLRTLTLAELQQVMHISPALAQKTAALFASWTPDLAQQSLAADSFVGDIYSGLRAGTLTTAERDYADQHLRILSGLYGVLRPYDGICPYRLEMGYRLPSPDYASLYAFWGDRIARCLPGNGLVVNLASAEYSRTVLPFIDETRVVSPKFLTRDPRSGEPSFVVVHAKIARGAFARWLIVTRIAEASRLQEFADLGYCFDTALSTPAEPVFVCESFGGKGLSMRTA